MKMNEFYVMTGIIVAILITISVIAYRRRTEGFRENGCPINTRGGNIGSKCLAYCKKKSPSPSDDPFGIKLYTCYYGCTCSCGYDPSSRDSCIKHCCPSGPHRCEPMAGSDCINPCMCPNQSKYCKNNKFDASDFSKNYEKNCTYFYG